MKVCVVFLSLNAVKAFVSEPRSRLYVSKPSITTTSPSILQTMSDLKDNIGVIDEKKAMIKEPTTIPSSSSKNNLGAWIPVGSASALEDVTPAKITIMDKDFAVWQDKKTLEWSVVNDVCPHRLAPLSQGRVDPGTGCLECPYHGWQYNTEGTCTKIPQMDEEKNSIPSEAKVKGYPVHMAGDMIFAFFPTEMHGETFDKTVLPDDFYPYLKDEIERKSQYYVRELPYSFDFLLENFMDPAHIPFAHHGLQSKREDATSIPIKQLVGNETLIELSFNDVTRSKERRGIMSFQVPSMYHFRENFDSTNDTYKAGLVIYCIPVKAGKVRVMYDIGDFGGLSLPAWISHAASNQFLNTDTWLHDVERNAIIRDNAHDGAKGLGFDYLYASESDKGTVQFRKWWKNRFVFSPPNTFGAATPEQLGPYSIPRHDQINPWDNHAKHCSSCRRTLKKIKLIQKICLYSSIASIVLLFQKKRFFHPILAFAFATTGISASSFCRKAATVIEGNPYASGIGDRSVSMEIADESDGKFKIIMNMLKSFYL